MKIQRGDVVLVLFPNSDLRTAKRRPALILQRDNLGSGLAQTIIAMISSNPARAGHPLSLRLRGFAGDEMGSGATGDRECFLTQKAYDAETQRENVLCPASPATNSSEGWNASCAG